MTTGTHRRDVTASIHPSTMDLMVVYREVFGVSERAGAIVIVAFIEDILEKAILARLRPLTNSESSKLTEGVQAPLNTLYAKIQFGYALYLFSAAVRDGLMVLKDIRNRFAHRIHSQDFSDAEVVKLCNRLHFTAYAAAESGSAETNDAEERFDSAAHYIMSELRRMAEGAVSLSRITDVPTQLNYPHRHRPNSPEASRKKVLVRPSRRNPSQDQT
jgi:hypothetical protein